MSLMQDCVFMPCVECGTYVFALSGGEMVATGQCRPCRNGWKVAPGKANPFGVRPGQRWVSLDPRDNGREIEVLEVDLGDGRATVLSQGARKRKIKLTNFTRLKGRGYELRRSKHVDDLENEDHDQKHEADGGVVHDSLLIDEANGQRSQNKVDGRVDGDLTASRKPKRDRVA